MLFYNVNTAANILFYLILSKMQDSPAAPLQVFVFALVFLYYILKAVPVNAIGFDCKFLIGEGNINYPPRYRKFFNVFDAPFVKFTRYQYLNCGWGIKSDLSVSVGHDTGSGAELTAPIFNPRWIYLKFISTLLADSLQFYTARRFWALGYHAFLATVSSALIVIAAFENMYWPAAIQAFNINILGSLKPFQPNVKAFIRTESAALCYRGRRGITLSALFAEFNRGHDKILPIQDNRMILTDGAGPLSVTDFSERFMRPRLSRLHYTTA